MKIIWLGASGYNPLVGQVETGKEYTVNKETFNKLNKLGLLKAKDKTKGK